MSPERESGPAADTAAPERAGRLDLALAAACGIAAFVLYLPTLRHGFVASWDDGDFIVKNGLIRELDLSNLWKAFDAGSLHYFHPLTWLSYAVDYRVWGSGPFGFHLGNALLHAGSAALAFLVARALLASAGVGLAGRALRAAALVASLAWALHPLRVESVAWAAERKGVLSAFLALAAILSYLAHVRSKRPFSRSGWYGATLLLFFLALMAKTSLVTLPLALAIADGFPLRRPGGWRSARALGEKGLLLAVALGVAARFTATSNAMLTQSFTEAGLVSRALVALRGAWEQALLTAWPSGLSPFYLHPGAVGLGDLSWSLPAAATIALTAGSVLWVRRLPGASAAWLAWLVLLAPGLAATQISATWMADRFTYLPSFALTLLAVGAVAGAVDGRGARDQRVVVAAAASWLLVLALLSVRQEAVWKDDVSLWTRPIELSPRRSGRVYANRAFVREAAGDVRGALSDLDVAIEIAAEKRFNGIWLLYERRAGFHRALGMEQESLEDERLARQFAAGP